MSVETEDLLAIVSPIRDGLDGINELMDVHGTHMARLRIVADQTFALMGREIVQKQEWSLAVKDHLEAAIACYEDLVNLESLYADIAEGISDSMAKLRLGLGE